MRSGADTSAKRPSRAQLLDRIREMLEQAGGLGAAMREGLKRADVESIEGATSRLQTLALEFKLLEAEYRRLPVGRDEAPADRVELARSRARLEQAATRLARSAAVVGGLLERMVAMSRNLLAALDAAAGESYLPNGLTRESRAKGIRLREQA